MDSRANPEPSPLVDRSRRDGGVDDLRGGEGILLGRHPHRAPGDDPGRRRPHVAPVWFVIDGDDLVLMTGVDTVKGRNLAREGRAAVSVDDPAPPYSFVLVEGPVTLSDDLEEVLALATRIGRRNMGDDEAESYGRRNAVPGELLVRLRMEKVTAAADIAD